MSGLDAEDLIAVAEICVEVFCLECRTLLPYAEAWIETEEGRVRRCLNPDCWHFDNGANNK